jgi:hypothetical protein
MASNPLQASTTRQPHIVKSEHLASVVVIFNYQRFRLPGGS